MANRFVGSALLGALSGGAFCLLLSGAVAGDMATRCDSYGCARIVCHDHGNRCYRTDAYDDRYSRSGYDRYRDSDRDRDYRYRYGRYRDDDAYSRYDRDGASWRYDCNHNGDRCTVRREPEGEW